MLVDKNQLTTALNFVKVGLGNEMFADQMGHFIFTGSDVITYNNAICAMHPLEVEVEIPVSVNAKDLMAFVKRAQTAEISVALDGNFMVFKSGRARAKLSTVVKSPIVDFVDKVISDMSELGNNWFEIPNGFLNAVSCLTNLTVKRDEHGVMSCLKFEDEQVYAAEAVTMTRATLEKKMGSFLIDAANAKHVAGMTPNVFGDGKAWIHFSDDSGRSLSVRKVNGQFPNIEGALAIPTGPVVLIPVSDDMVHAIDTCGAINKLIRITVREKGATVESVGSTSNVREEVLFPEDSKAVKEPITFQCDASQIMRVLNLFPEIQYSESLSRIIFESETMTHHISARFTGDTEEEE